MALTAEAAHWAVETWALALGVIAGPVTFAAPTPTPGIASQPPPKPANETRPPTSPPFRDRLKDGGEGPEMVQLPPGRFLMGSPDGDDLANDNEQPQHEVRIARPFAIGRYPVTFDDYDRFVLATRKRGLMERLFGDDVENKQRELPGDQSLGRSRRPVINISWFDAVAYCVWLSGQTGRTYRLPSEAEWEYACRAGTATRWSCRDDEKALSDYAWFDANSGGKTQPVGEKRPNPWGLHDMHGNVWEWVLDQRHSHYQGAPADGSVWGNASVLFSSTMLRGGSWWDDARSLRSADRFGLDPGNRSVFYGFRLALGPELGSAAAGK